MLKKQSWFLLFILGLLCLFLGCIPSNYDFDFFARIIVGERFIEEGILPFKDFLSYTPTHTWFDHEWGSGIVFYLVLKYLGAGGIILLHSLLMFGIVFFVYKTQKLQKHALPPSLLFLSLFLVLFAHINPNLIRCQMFSFFFFSVFLYLLEKHRKDCSKSIWLIPFITIIWNNLHGGVVSGLGIVLIYFVAALIKKQPSRTYFKVLVLSLLLLIINPYGINYLTFLFSAALKSRKYIMEWMPFYTKRHFTYYIIPSLYAIYAFISLIIRNIKTARYDLVKLLVVTATVVEGLWHIKLLSLSLIVSASLCYNEMSYIFLKLKKIFKTIEKCLPIVIILTSLTIPLYSPCYPRADFYKFPLKEVEFLKINNIKGNIVVPFGYGSYVSYKLYPDNLIFMDGRYEEVYYDKEFDVLHHYESVHYNWDDIIKNYPTDFLMPSNMSEIYKFLKINDNWILIYDGKLCGIFVHKDRIKEHYKKPACDINYYRKTIFDGYFGKKIRSYKV